MTTLILLMADGRILVVTYTSTLIRPMPSVCLLIVGGEPEKASQAIRKPAVVAPALTPRPGSLVRASTRRYFGNMYTLGAHWPLRSWRK